MKQHLSFKNITGYPAKSVVLITLSTIMAISIMIGSITIISLNMGLSALETRLGADILVVPKSAASNKNLENILLQGEMGYFYMDKSVADDIKDIDGIEKTSTQLFLSSASAGCCSVPLQIIGYDPETDFTVSSWIKESAGRDLDKFDVVVGSDLSVFLNDSIRFYGIDCNVISKLEKTGTGLDTSVYTNADTIKALIAASVDKGLNAFKNIDPESIISCVLIKVKNGHSFDDIVDEISNRCSDVKVVKSKDMLSSVSNSLMGTINIVTFLMIAVWVLGFVILFLAFTLSINERKKEFAVLRAMGASKRKINRLMVSESSIITVSGSCFGILCGLLIMLPFNAFIESSLGLPFLLPSALILFLLSVAVLIVSTVAGIIAGVYSSYQINKADAGVILRSDN